MARQKAHSLFSTWMMYSTGTQRDMLCPKVRAKTRKREVKGAGFMLHAKTKQGKVTLDIVMSGVAY